MSVFLSGSLLSHMLWGSRKSFWECSSSLLCYVCVCVCVCVIKRERVSMASWQRYNKQTAIKVYQHNYKPNSIFVYIWIFNFDFFCGLWGVRNCDPNVDHIFVSGRLQRCINTARKVLQCSNFESEFCIKTQGHQAAKYHYKTLFSQCHMIWRRQRDACQSQNGQSGDSFIIPQWANLLHEKKKKKFLFPCKCRNTIIKQTVNTTAPA